MALTMKTAMTIGSVAEQNHLLTSRGIEAQEPDPAGSWEIGPAIYWKLKHFPVNFDFWFLFGSPDTALLAARITALLAARIVGANPEPLEH